MRPLIFRLTIFLCMFAIFPANAFSEDEEEVEPFRTGVQLEFSGDEDLRVEAIQSWAAALKSLGDADWVKTNGNWEFRITAVHAGMSPSGQDQISVVAVLLLPFRIEFVRAILGKLDPKKELELQETISELYRYHGLWLKTIPRNELAGFARDIIAEFNQRYLTTHRRLYEKLIMTQHLTKAVSETEEESKEKSKEKPDKSR